MADYARTSVVTLYSENSDFSDPIIEASYAFEPSSPTKQIEQRINALTSGDVALDLSTFTTVQAVVIRNKSTTTSQYVKVTYNSTDLSSCTQRVPKGDWIKLVDVTVAGDLTFRASGADGYVDVIVIGT